MTRSHPDGALASFEFVNSRDAQSKDLRHESSLPPYIWIVGHVGRSPNEIQCFSTTVVMKTLVTAGKSGVEVGMSEDIGYKISLVNNVMMVMPLNRNSDSGEVNIFRHRKGVV